MPLLLPLTIGAATYYLLTRNGQPGVTPVTNTRPAAPPSQPLPAIYYGNTTDETLLAQTMQGQAGASAGEAVWGEARWAMQNQQMRTAENCSGVNTGSNATLITQASGTVAGAGVSIGATTGALAAPVTLGISLAITGAVEIFTAIFQHHAKAVAQERSIICAVVRAMNDSFSVLDQAYQQAAVTPQQALDSLDKMYSDLKTTVQPILKNDSSHCNAACYILAEARAVIAKKKQLYTFNSVSLECAQAYWDLYPDVKNSVFGQPGENGAPAAYMAWFHYWTSGRQAGRIWPCAQSRY